MGETGVFSIRILYLCLRQACSVVLNKISRKAFRKLTIRAVLSLIVHVAASGLLELC